MKQPQINKKKIADIIAYLDIMVAEWQKSATSVLIALRNTHHMHMLVGPNVRLIAETLTLSTSGMYKECDVAKWHQTDERKEENSKTQNEGK